jgi:surface protein
MNAGNGDGGAPHLWRLRKVTQWGNIEWASMEAAFKGCPNLDITATDTPDLSNTNSTAEMFRSCYNMAGNTAFSAWDVSTITNMESMFYEAVAFDQPINSWNVSNVTTMENMFRETSFNQALNNWNVGNVETMKGMFSYNNDFNQSLNTWNVSRVTNMEELFESTTFNQPLHNWDVSNVENMKRMFGNSLFNQNLGSWDISSAINMANIFRDSALSLENYDNTLIGWATLDTGEMQIPINISIGANSQYCYSETKRQELIDTYSWTISDDGLDITCNTANSIVTFSLTEEVAIANINESNSTITVAVPFTTDVTALIPTITVSTNATINPNTGIAQDFTNPFTYIVTAENGRERLWTVTVIRAPGITTATSINVPENQTAVVDINTTDPQGDTEGNGLTYSFTSTNGGTDNGLFNLDASTGVITFITAPNYESPSDNDTQNDYEVQVTVTNSSGLTDIQNITVFVTNSNDIPNAVDDTATTDEETAITIDLTANDIDIDGDNLTIQSIDDSSLYGQVTIQADNKTISYNTNSNFEYLGVGQMDTDSFTYTISDGNGGTSSATVTITITGVNDPVQAVNDAESTLANESVTISLTSNDIDLDFDNLTITSADTTGDIGGLVTIVPGGSGITFDPNGEFDTLLFGESVDVNFDYTVTDGITSDTAAVTITVEGTSTEGAFITTWAVQAGESITIPTNSSYTYDYAVVWGDGSPDDISGDYHVTGDITHTYTDAGTYTVKIIGDFPAINFGGISDTDKIMTIEQWGTNQWATMDSAFEDCTNINITNPTIDTPDLSNVTSMEDMFYDCVYFNGDISNWDVSNVQNFDETFGYCYSFNQPIGNWNMSSATNLDFMFYEAVMFNQPLNNWNTSNVVSMEGVFADTEAFNQDLDNWDVSNVVSMSEMFDTAEVFNGNIGSWNVSNVKDMQEMFDDAYQFNQDISNWDVSNVENMGSMFDDAEVFNQDISGWNVSNVIKMYNMFDGADAFDQNLGDWDLSSIVNTNLSRSGLRNMFGSGLFGSSLSLSNYDDTLIGWSTDSSGIPNDGIDDIPAGIRFGGGKNEYCRSVAERQHLIDTYGWNISDRGQINDCIGRIEATVYLQGASINPNIGEENLMRDDLRIGGFIPTRSPYADMIDCDPAVFDTMGTDAIVDWVWVEIHDNVSNTLTGAQSAFLQRDGDIVAVDGTSPLTFYIDNVDYFITIKHRNHLGIRTASAITLVDIPVPINFTDGTTPTFGTHAQTNFGMPSGMQAMWTGNVNGDTIIQYSGVSSDTPDILSEILNDPGNFLNFSTYIVNGYAKYDLNMDGSTQYSGTNPDTPIILQNVLAHPGNFLNFSTYQIKEQLPNTND